jgi:hypothetical protein
MTDDVTPIDDLDARIRELVAALALSAPPPPVLTAERLDAARIDVGLVLDGEVVADGWDEPPARRRWLAVAAGAAAAAVVAGVVVVSIDGSREDGPVETGTTGVVTDPTIDSTADPATTVAPSGFVTVEHEIVTYVQEAELDCPGGFVATSGSFDEHTIESWGDTAGGRWRQTVTYPDGTTRSLLVTGNPWYPIETWTQGEPQGRTLGCVDDMFLGEPTTWTGVEPITPPPTSAWGEPAVLGPEQQGELVERDVVDSLGRPAEYWRSVVDGSRVHVSGEAPIHQVQEWWVDPATRRVLERTYEYAVEGVGVVRYRMTSTARDQVEVADDVFDASGFTRVVDTWWGDPPVLATPGASAGTGLAERWVWPDSPWPGTPEEVGREVAAAIGWDDAAVGVVDTGPVRIVLTGPDDREVAVSAIRSGTGLVVHGAGDGVTVWGIGPGARLGIRMRPESGAVWADVFVRTDGTTTAWQAALAPTAPSVIVPVAWSDVESALVVLRDDAGVALDVGLWAPGALASGPAAG